MSRSQSNQSSRRDSFRQPDEKVDNPDDENIINIDIDPENGVMDKLDLFPEEQEALNKVLFAREIAKNKDNRRRWFVLLGSMFVTLMLGMYFWLDQWIEVRNAANELKNRINNAEFEPIRAQVIATPDTGDRPGNPDDPDGDGDGDGDDPNGRIEPNEYVPPVITVPGEAVGLDGSDQCCGHDNCLGGSKQQQKDAMEQAKKRGEAYCDNPVSNKLGCAPGGTCETCGSVCANQCCPCLGKKEIEMMRVIPPEGNNNDDDESHIITPISCLETGTIIAYPRLPTKEEKEDDSYPEQLKYPQDYLTGEPNAVVGRVIESYSRDEFAASLPDDQREEMTANIGDRVVRLMLNKPIGNVQTVVVTQAQAEAADTPLCGKNGSCSDAQIEGCEKCNENTTTRCGVPCPSSEGCSEGCGGFLKSCMGNCGNCHVCRQMGHCMLYSSIGTAIAGGAAVGAGFGIEPAWASYGDAVDNLRHGMRTEGGEELRVEWQVSDDGGATWTPWDMEGEVEYYTKGTEALMRTERAGINRDLRVEWQVSNGGDPSDPSTWTAWDTSAGEVEYYTEGNEDLMQAFGLTAFLMTLAIVCGFCVLLGLAKRCIEFSWRLDPQFFYPSSRVPIPKAPAPSAPPLPENA